MTAEPQKKTAFVPKVLGRSDYAIIGEIVEPGRSGWLGLRATSLILLLWTVQTERSPI